jgi:hypothetical protein
VSDDDEGIELGEPDELPVYNQSMSVIEELKSHVRKLEAERDSEIQARIYAEKLLMNEPCTVKEHTGLIARHAALVEAVIGCRDISHGILKGILDMSKIQDIDRILKAALAEVK